MERDQAKATARALGRFALDVAAEALWPTRCAVCDEPGEVLCERCLAALPYIDACRACPTCGAPFGFVQCSECNPVMLKAGGRESVPFQAAASALSLDERTHRIVSAYKDQGEQRLAAVMARIMARCIAPAWITPGALVTYVPATAAAVRRRGFDHAELLSFHVAQYAGLPHAGMFARPKSSDQRGLSRSRRQANMENRLRTLPGLTPPKAAIVIDDVCTTGATLYAACDALAESGVQATYGLTFARTW